jgi:hypothetical protein
MCEVCGERQVDGIVAPDAPRARARLCAVCRAERCATCGRHGGKHNAKSHNPPPPAPPRYDRVSFEAVAELYEVERSTAIRMAAAQCGASAAEDLVQNAILSILTRAPFLRYLSSCYFRAALTHGVWRERDRARRYVAVDPVDLATLGDDELLAKYGQRSGTRDADEDATS